jgi:hypothetical protein
MIDTSSVTSQNWKKHFERVRSHIHYGQELRPWSYKYIYLISLVKRISIC